MNFLKRDDIAALLPIMFVFICLVSVSWCLLSRRCNECEAFNKIWLGKPSSRLIEVYGKPNYVFPTESQVLESPNIGLSTSNGRVQNWNYDDLKMSFYISLFDKKVCLAYRRDHKHFGRW